MLKGFWALIAYGNNFAVGEPIKISDNAWSPIAIADNANVDHILYLLSPVSVKI
jgi:hypothetical protein